MLKNIKISFLDNTPKQINTLLDFLYEKQDYLEGLYLDIFEETPWTNFPFDKFFRCIRNIKNLRSFQLTGN